MQKKESQDRNKTQNIPKLKTLGERPRTMILNVYKIVGKVIYKEQVESELSEVSDITSLAS